MSKLGRATRKLRARYAEGLPAKWRVVEEALAQLRHGEGEVDDEAEQTLRRVAHQVRGSAASFGFVAIDKTASRVEHAKGRVALERGAEAFLLALRAAYQSESTPIGRVLLIDDDPDIGMMVSSLLSEDELGITQVVSAAEGVEALRDKTWDIIFVDLVLPDADGRSLLTQLRALPQHRDTPVVVLSAKTSSLVKNECAVYGADDFLVKPIDPATFAVHVAAMLERTRSHQPVTTTDSLTGLPNRLGFRRALSRLSAAQRAPLTVGVIEIDPFEAYARRAGQTAADRAIELSASILRAKLRDGDLLARWGGQEFIVGFPGSTPIDAIGLLRGAVEALREQGPQDDSGPELGLRLGATELQLGEPLDYALLRADQLLRQARRKDSWYAHSLESSDDARPRLLLAEDDPDMAALLLHDLADDFEITYAADGNAALAHAETSAAAGEPFAIMLLDYQMPHRDGVEVVRALRAHPAYAKTPMLLLTAVGSDAAVEAAFEAGADDYINKPHRKRALIARLTRHLGRSETSSESSSPGHVGEGVETSVTAMFCDISGFAGLTANMAPREILALLNLYFPIISRIVLRHGGVLEKYIGDAVLAVWGAPRPTPDDVVHALTAAVEIQAAVTDLAEITEPPLRVHIGLNSGLVVAARIDGEGPGQYAAVGATTTLASRVCDLAGPGQIVVSGSCVEALAGRSRWPLLGPRTAEVKGRAEAIEVFELDWSA